MMPQNNETVAMLVSKPILWRGGGGGGVIKFFRKNFTFKLTNLANCGEHGYRESVGI